jgi:hypothetical protein
MPYKDQAVWFLNGFWKDGLEAESENIWNFTQKFVELDLKNKAAGNELDEFGAHRFLESFGETLTVVDMRAQLKKIDIDVNQKCALIEYLIFRWVRNSGGGGFVFDGGGIGTLFSSFGLCWLALGCNFFFFFAVAV